MKAQYSPRIFAPGELFRRVSGDRSGVSLIELLIVIVLLGTGFFSLLQVLTFSSDKRAEAEIRTVQEALGNDLMNEIRSKRFDEYFIPQWSSGLGAEEASPLDYDDVDDYAGWSESSVSDYPHYSRSAEVVYVDAAGDLKQVVAGPTDYKLVTVSVGHKTLSDIVDSLVITPGIPNRPFNDYLCMAEGLEFKNMNTGELEMFFGPFPKRVMTFTVDGGTGTFTVDCSSCLNEGDRNGSLEITKIYDPSGLVVAACGGS